MTDQNKELLSNTLALNLALQTIKERCVHLQKRLFALESENSRLRLNTINSDNKNESQNSLSEIEELRAKNAELSLQKSQLTENLSMISTENRKLWKRLSQLTKENGNEENPEEKASPNLIRSKTFTQNSPHQLLKEKLVGHQVGPDELEDISLLNDCGFSAFDDSEASDIDSKTCTDGMLNIKKELMKQNSDLKVALSNWRKMKVCSCKKNEKPVMVDKELETDRDVALELEIEADATNNFEITKHETVLIDLIEQKRAADAAEKVRKIVEVVLEVN
jgi:hypothetical protein